MKKRLSIALLVGCLAASAPAADFDIGISGSERGIDGFTLSIGDYYHVPTRDIVVVERSIPRDELSVVYFLAGHAHRDVAFITDLRLRGLSWWDISIRLGLDPRTLYVIDSRRPWGPPYGKAYGYRSNGYHQLRDHEIVELVNVRFLSDYHRVSVDDIIDRRRKGERYYYIDDHYRGKKVYPQERREYREERREDRREYRDERREDRREYRDERREGRVEYRDERRDERAQQRNERRDDRAEQRNERREGRVEYRNDRGGDRGPGDRGNGRGNDR